MLKMARFCEEETQMLSDLNEKLEFYQRTEKEKEETSLHLSLFSSEPPLQNNSNALSSLVIVRWGVMNNVICRNAMKHDVLPIV